MKLNTTKDSAALVSKAFVELGGRYVVVSPGSRNAPLLIAFQASNKVELITIVDERSAAFFALGLALYSKSAVGLICTSGTAVLNYSPAIAEAFYLGAPIVVMSADRPTHLIDKGVGQSIQQQNVFTNFQKGFLQVEEKGFNLHQIFKLMNSSVSGKNGPVHFNLPFEEPLYDVAQREVEVETPNFIKQTTFNTPSDFPNLRGKKVLLVVGLINNSYELKNVFLKLDCLKSIVVLYETTSNNSLPNSFGEIDKMLTRCKDQKYNPDVVFTLGEHVISKHIKSRFQNVENLEHYHINEAGIEQDIFGHVRETLKYSTLDFLNRLINSDFDSQDFYSLWNNQKKELANKHNEFLNGCAYSDLKVFEQITESIPSNWNVQSANSSVIRYFQLFNNRSYGSFHANRGTSGIDGSSSTAVGFAYKANEPTILVTGDLSFLYDSNALWLNYIRADFRIILINNSGGGIFRFIEGPTSVKDFETHFETKSQVNVEKLSEAFGLDYSKAINIEELQAELLKFYETSDKPKILEVFTPNTTNPKVLKDYFNFIAQ